MYLIRIDMSLQQPEARNALADCEKLHTLVTGMFESDRLSSGILFRTDVKGINLKIYLYASVPVCETAAKKYNVVQRDITFELEQYYSGQYLGFDILACPSKKVAVEGKKNSRRIIIREPGNRLKWLEGKAAQSGFEVINVNELERTHLSGTHCGNKGGRMHIDAYHYQGMLRVNDCDLFRNMMKKGIGSGKAYGFGMMLVKTI